MNYQIYDVIAFQISVLLLLVIIWGIIFKGESFTILSKSFRTRFLLGSSLAVFVILNFTIPVTDKLFLFIIFFGLLLVFTDLINELILLLLVFLCYALVVEKEAFFIYVFLFVLIQYIVIHFLKNEKRKLYMIMVLSQGFLNFELFYNRSVLCDYLIYNVVALMTWHILIYLIAYFSNRFRIINELKQKNFIDPSTGMNNYNVLMNDSAQILQKKNSNIALILISVGRYLDISNLYGGEAVERTMNELGTVIKSVIQNNGRVYRLDQSTFCVIYLKEKLKVIKLISEKIRLDANINNLIMGNNKINSAVSIGAYYGGIVSDKIDDYIEMAYNSLLKSKAGGGNKVTINAQMDVN